MAPEQPAPVFSSGRVGAADMSLPLYVVCKERVVKIIRYGLLLAYLVCLRPD